jgi:hypothetical protein
MTSAPASPEPALHMSPAVERAWRGYLEALETARRFIFSRPFCERPEVREAANYYLMQIHAAAYAWTIAPHPDYPRFHLGLFEPMVWNWAMPCPDFRYRWAFVDGAQTYRIWGRKGDARFLDIQVMTALGALDKDAYRQAPTAAYPVDAMPADAESRFEITASPEPQDGNWIRLDPAQGRMMLFVREAIYDWANDKPALLRIERVGDAPPRPMRHDEVEMVARIDQAARFVTFVVEDWGVAGFDRAERNQAGARNTFVWHNAPSNSGVNPAARYANMVFDIGPDDALILECDRPTSRYWSFCIADRYLQLADFTYHQSSLNGHQARIDSDGKVRAVLSRKDPGAPNWLDPVDTAPLGVMQFRQFFQETAVEPPTVRKVAVSDVAAHLPPDTPKVTREARAQQLRDRSWAALGLYGY